MSFFGFDSSGGTKAGFSSADPFSSLLRPTDLDDDDGIDFEDTYDGLVDQLDETDDVYNDDTFGGGGGGTNVNKQKPPGKDFDFFGQTAKVSDVISEEQMRFSRQQAPPRHMPTETELLTQQYPQHYAQHFSQQPHQQSHHQRYVEPFVQQRFDQPARSGYERYQDASYLQDIEADESIWGGVPKKSGYNVEPSDAATTAPVGRKMMSLEEVEAAMRAQTKKAEPAPPLEQQIFTAPELVQLDQRAQQPQQYEANAPLRTRPDESSIDQKQPSQVQPIQILQRVQPASNATQHVNPPAQDPATVRAPAEGLGQPQVQQQVSPMKILQNPNRHGPAVVSQPQVPLPTQAGPPRGPVATQQQHQQYRQFPAMTDEQRQHFMQEEGKRAKRNRKIEILSRGNGLMTPQDKNFITRIQLQQLVTATGNPSESGSDSALAEDFYYQVLNQIRGGARQTPNQPLSNFAQTYLFQTGGRHGNLRRQNRGADNHVQRMEQQVQRAVEAAKNQPKNKQLVIEGSLGKISFSNAKTPKPLLNIKPRDDGARPKKTLTVSDRKAILRSIENVYSILMQMEDNARKQPPPVSAGDINPELVGRNRDWSQVAEKLNGQLWEALKVHHPIGETSTHPFISFLSLAKGKKAIPRVFTHINHEQRTTILTLIFVHLEQLDVIHDAQLAAGETHLSASMRESVELFSNSVLPALFAFINELGLQIVHGLLGLAIERLNIHFVARTRIGLSMFTILLSRVELIKQAGAYDEKSWEEWSASYNSFFDLVEPSLSQIFPPKVNTGEDVYVWQFLAAMGVGAGPEQQQRLVMAVKDKVMETVGLAKTLPPAMSGPRLANVNLFMRSIGLDVELLA